MKTGVANLPLHGGHCPKWLFPRMKNLSREMSKIIVYEYGQDELLRRLSDPFWFQAFGCVLGFDWHSSGLTTTVCGALKEGLNEEQIGLSVCGGKGKTSRKTPDEIKENAQAFSLTDGKIDDLIYSSRMAAKVDSACIQDGYQLYHHVFVFNEKGKWSVIQQGLNGENKYARRYHWLSENIVSFVEESQLIAGRKESNVLNMVAEQSKEAQKICVDVVNDKKFLNMPRQHEITDLTPRTQQALSNAADIHPENYEELVSLRGIGPKGVRALALVSQLIYGATPSWNDPVKFSFAHGGKDGHPFFVKKDVMDRSINILRDALNNAKLDEKDRLHAIRRLNDFISN